MRRDEHEGPHGRRHGLGQGEGARDGEREEEERTGPPPTRARRRGSHRLHLPSRHRGPLDSL